MSKSRSTFLSAISGNILEYYDFTVYAVFSFVIGDTFFPGGSHYIKVLLSLSVFAVGFVTRPIGGILFGYIADKYGRRLSLIISMLGMTIPTFVIGLIPSFTDIGYFAPTTLVIMRLLQGLCISGEGAGAAIFLLEHTQNFRPGFTAGLVHASNIAGTLLATLVGILLEYLLPNVDLAWRFAFILGGVMGLAGFYLRLRVSETPIFILLSEKKKTLKIPFLHVIKTAWSSVIVTVAIGACASSIVYLVKTYINIYHCDILHYDTRTAKLYLAYAAIVMMITMPISGHFADTIGRFRMVISAAFAILVLALPCFYLLSNSDMLYQLLALTMLSILGGNVAASAYIFIISLFAPEERFSGVAFSYNLGIALCGGTSAAIARFLLETTGKYYAPAYYIMFTSAVFLLIAYILKSRIRHSLETHLKKQ